MSKNELRDRRYGIMTMLFLRGVGVVPAKKQEVYKYLAMEMNTSEKRWENVALCSNSLKSEELEKLKEFGRSIEAEIADEDYECLVQIPNLESDEQYHQDSSRSSSSRSFRKESNSAVGEGAVVSFGALNKEGTLSRISFDGADLTRISVSLSSKEFRLQIPRNMS